MPSEQRFADVHRLLERHGWTLTRIHGSHHIFTRDGEGPISIPVHRNKVKAVYVRKIEKILEEQDDAR